MVRSLVLAALLTSGAPLHAQDHLLQRPDVRQALEYLRKNEGALIGKQIQISQIPAPTFQEAKRGGA